MGPPTEQSQQMKVEDLISPISKTWDRMKISQILPQYEQQILELRPSRFGAKDRYVWLLTKSGEYSAKSGYHAASSSKTSLPHLPSSPLVFNWNKEIWNKHCSPKVKFFLWKAMKNALPVGANLRARWINPDAFCPHCGDEETCLHMLFHCQFAQQVWLQTPFKISLSPSRISSLKQGLEASNHLKVLPPIGLNHGPLFPWILWMIWICRNKMIFEKKQQSSGDLITQAITYAKEWNEAQIQPIRNPLLPPSPLSSPLGVEPVDIETTICFTDAAWRDSGDAGYGWTFVNFSTQFESQGQATGKKICSPLMAEASALFLAIHQAVDFGFKKLSLASDSQQLVKALNGEPQPEELRGILHDILTLSLYFDEICFRYVKRASNVSADTIAKAALNSISAVPFCN